MSRTAPRHPRTLLGLLAAVLAPWASGPATAGEAVKAPGGLTPLAATASATVADLAVTPAAAVDREGGIHVVYFDSKAKNVLLAVSRDGGKTFGAPVTAIDTGGRGQAGAQRGPRVAVDDRKTVYVSTCLGSEKPVKEPWEADVLIAASRDGGKTFSPPIRVNDAPGSTPERYQALAVEPDGGAHLAWLDLRKKPQLGQMIYTAKVTVGDDGRPAAASNIEVYVSPKGSVCECCDVGIAAAGGGKVAIAFRNSLADGSRDAFLAVSTDGGSSFAPAVKVGRTRWKAPGCPMDAPAVAGSADGKTLAVAWMDRRQGDEDPDLWWVAMPGGFGPPGAGNAPAESSLASSRQGRQTHPSLAVDAEGTVLAAWEDNRPGWPAIALTTSKSGKRDFLLSEKGEGKASFPQVAAAGKLAVVVYEAGGKVIARIFDCPLRQDAAF
jgi:hypothetical protein